MGDLTAEDARRLLVGTTPGPWRVIDDTPWGSKVVFNESGQMFVGVSAYTVEPLDGWPDEVRAQAIELGAQKCADARLVAAAPALAAAVAASHNKPNGEILMGELSASRERLTQARVALERIAHAEGNGVQWMRQIAVEALAREPTGETGMANDG